MTVSGDVTAGGVSLDNHTDVYKRQAVYYDEAAKKITTVASTGESSSKVNNIPAGYAAAPAASADENVLVKLLG